MNKTIKTVFIIALIALENIAVLYGVYLYKQKVQYNEVLKSNQGLTRACEGLVTSESLFSVLQKMKAFNSNTTVSSDKIFIKFGDEWANNPGVALLFDENYRLTHKFCNSKWEPNTPDLPAVK